MRHSRKGFSLPEILIVVAIIAILAAIGIPHWLRVKINANDAAAQATLKAVSTALENYMASYSVYPSDPNDLITGSPPYLTKDYFTGTHNGFTFSPNITEYTYSVTATPATMGSTGTRSYTMTTGGVLTAN